MDKERGFIVCAVTALATEYFASRPDQGPDGFAAWLDEGVIDKVRAHAADAAQVVAKTQGNGGGEELTSRFHAIYQQVMDGYASAKERWRALSELDRRILVELMSEVEKDFDGANPFGPLFLPVFAEQMKESIEVVQARLVALTQRGFVSITDSKMLGMPHKGILFVWEANSTTEFDDACASLAAALPRGDEYSVAVASAAQMSGITPLLALSLVELWAAQGYLRLRDNWPKSKVIIQSVMPALRVAYPRPERTGVSADHDALDSMDFPAPITDTEQGAAASGPVAP